VQSTITVMSPFVAFDSGSLRGHTKTITLVRSSINFFYNYGWLVSNICALNSFVVGLSSSAEYSWFAPQYCSIIEASVQLGLNDGRYQDFFPFSSDE
jgi:hypothetical protein